MAIMPTPPIIWGPPESFTAGDSLIFQLNLPSYPPSAGWSVVLTVTMASPNGGQQVAQYTSTPDAATGQFHCFNVLAFLAGQTSGSYNLTMELVCSPMGVSPNQRSQIYSGNLDVLADLTDGAAVGTIYTYAQQMIGALEAKLLRLEAIDLSETDVQRTRFIIDDKNKTTDRLKYWYEKRNEEIKTERQRNTGISQVTIRPAFAGGW